MWLKSHILALCLSLWILAPPRAIAQEPAGARGLRPVIEPAQTRGSTYALVIGISHYEKVRSLEYADKDAELLTAFLQSKLGGVDPANILLLENEKATRGAIDDAVKNFVGAHAAADNSLILFVAGHGVYLKTEVDPVTNKAIEQPWILTYDSNPEDPKTTGYPMDEFRNMIATQALRYGRVMVYADVCHAANIAGIGGGSALQQAVSQVFRGAGGDLDLMVASYANKFAFESPAFGGGHGAFSYFLISGLNGSASFSGADTLHWNELAHYVNDQVFRFTSGKQSPRDFPTRDDLVVIPDLHQPGIELLPAQPLSQDQQRDASNRGLFIAPVVAAQSLPPRPPTDEIDHAIAKGALLPEDPDSADALVASLPAGSTARVQAGRRLRVALEDQGQAIISKYLEGDQIPQLPGDFSRCARIFEEAGRLAQGDDFDRSRELFCQGRALIFASRYAEAEALLQQSIQLDPKRAYAWNALGISHLEQINNRLAAAQVNSQWDQAAAAFRSAMRYAPYWAYPVHNLALTLSERGDFDGAIGLYQFAMQIGKQYSYLPYNLGLLYARLGDNSHARKWFEAAGKVAEAYPRKQNGYWPEKAQVLNALGTLAMARGDSVHAKTYFNDALTADPPNLNARQNLALLAAGAKDYAESDRLWTGVIADSPQFLAPRVSLAASLAERKQTAAAIAQYREILRLDPEWIGVHEALAKLYLETGDTAAAMQELDSSLRATPSNPYLLETRGDLMAKLGRASEAAADWSAALKSATDRAAGARLARKLKNSGRRSGA
jgi:tetratricopeptide (TPR) repeat protein